MRPDQYGWDYAGTGGTPLPFPDGSTVVVRERFDTFPSKKYLVRTTPTGNLDPKFKETVVTFFPGTSPFGGELAS